jgi:hypothetical protein
LRNTPLKKAIALALAFLLILAPRLAWAPYGTGGTFNTAKFADGSQTTPSISFISATNQGFYRTPATVLGYTQSGAYQLDFSTGGLALNTNNTLQWRSTGQDSVADLLVLRDAANTLAQRNGTNAQTFRLYNTFTDASNFERLNLTWATNVAQLTTTAAGTGTLRTMQIGPTGGLWTFATTGLTAATDNSLDIGATGATRPRDVFIARHLRSEAATVPNMGACGTTPSVTGSDHGATITVGAGGVATTCAMNFGVAFTAIPACVVNSNTDSTAFTVTTATGSVTITKATAFTAGSKLFVICMGS